MPSIGVLEHYQKPTDKPMRRIKRSGGQSLVRSGLAEWLIENVLLIMRPFTAHNLLKTQAKTTVIKPKFTGKMPSHKTPGTKAIGPVTEQNGQGRARILIANMIAAGR